MDSHSQHQRQTSLPPPYQSYDSYESISPTSTSPTSQPYLDNPSCNDNNNNITDTSLYLPYYTPLPAFNSPRNYSRRLRTLIESRHKPTVLCLRIPPPRQRQDLHIVLIDEKSAHSVSHDQSHLLPSLPCDEENELYSTRTRPSSQNLNDNKRRFRRRSSCGAEGEISWCSFSILAIVLFLLVCACSVFVAWTTGLIQTNGSLTRQMRVLEHDHTSVGGNHRVNVWGGIIGKVEITKTEGYVLKGEVDMPALSQYQQADVQRQSHDQDVKEKENAREKIQRRVKRRRHTSRRN